MFSIPLADAKKVLTEYAASPTNKGASFEILGTGFQVFRKLALRIDLRRITLNDSSESEPTLKVEASIKSLKVERLGS